MPVDQGSQETRRQAKVVLKQLRHHQQEVEDDHEEAVDCESDALQKHFEQAEENIIKSQTAHQSVVDAQIFHRLGQYTKKQAEKLQSGLRTYDVKSFADSLYTNMRQETDVTDDGDSELRINFVKLGDCVWEKYITVPSLDFMYGNEPKEHEIKKAPERKTRQVKKGERAIKPNELTSDQVEQTETDRRVAMMKKELENRKQCNFWLFVIDPDDFTLSVENVFHTSFLIKDSWAQLDLKRDPPILKYRDTDSVTNNNMSDVDQNGDHVSNSQYILEFDRTVWTEMIAKYDIQKCILPRPRERNQESEALRRIRQYGRSSSEDPAQVTASF